MYSVDSETSLDILDLNDDRNSQIPRRTLLSAQSKVMPTEIKFISMSNPWPFHLYQPISVEWYGGFSSPMSKIFPPEFLKLIDDSVYISPTAKRESITT